jgi:tetratricopeptide (TPR) repeat protein
MRRIRFVGMICVALCALLLVATPIVSWGQDLKEAEELNKKVIDLYDAGQYAEATPLAQRALSIQEKSLGPDHIDLTRLLENLAVLYSAQDRYADAEALVKRSLGIREAALGPEHPSLAPSLNNLALIYYNQNRYSEAEALHKRALLITEKLSVPIIPIFWKR